MHETYTSVLNAQIVGHASLLVVTTTIAVLVFKLFLFYYICFQSVSCSFNFLVSFVMSAADCSCFEAVLVSLSRFSCNYVHVIVIISIIIRFIIIMASSFQYFSSVQFLTLSSCNLEHCFERKTKGLVWRVFCLQ